MRAISLDNPGKTQFAMNLVRNANQRYFWTGGNMIGNGRQWTDVQWANGARQAVRNVGPWSHTGGANRPQPDNREGNENCLAVLNNFYNDGVRFHDVSCHHTKPTICEG